MNELPPMVAEEEVGFTFWLGPFLELFPFFGIFK